MGPNFHDDQSTERMERRVIALARDGVITGRHLRAAEIEWGWVEKCDEIGLIRRVRRDIYLLAGSRLEGSTAHRAALAISANSALSHWSAAHLHGLTRLAPDRVHFVAPNRGHIEDADWFTAHATRRLRPDEVTTRRGRRMTTVPRTIRDLAVFLPSDAESDAQITTLIETALRAKLTKLETLDRYIEREPSPMLRERLTRLVGRQRGGQRAELKSVGEDWVRELFDRLGLPAPLFNVWVNGHESDAYVPDRRLNLEFDGFAFHKYRTSHDGDRQRDRLLLVAGVNVARLTDTDFDSPGDLEREIRDLISLAPPEPAPGIAIATVSRHPSYRRASRD